MSELAVKLPAVFGGMFAAGRISAAVSLTEIILVVDTSIEMLRPVKPGSGPDKETVRKPVRPVIAVGSTVIRRNLVIPVRTNRRRSDTDGDLR